MFRQKGELNQMSKNVRMRHISPGKLKDHGYAEFLIVGRLA